MIIIRILLAVLVGISGIIGGILWWCGMVSVTKINKIRVKNER